MSGVDALSRIEYHRGIVQTFRRYDVFAPDDDAERRACDYMIRDLGWHLLNRSAVNQGWMLHFVYWTLVADTDREDPVRVDRRDGYG